MSTLSDIRTAMAEIIEGTLAGGVRLPTAGRFAVVGDDAVVQQADASTTPRPVYVGAGAHVDDPTLPSDVSGDYHWEAREIQVSVLYAYTPDLVEIAADQVLDDDEAMLKRGLSEPLNIATVTGWGKCVVRTMREAQRDAQQVEAIKVLTLICSIAYREDWS